MSFQMKIYAQAFKPVFGQRAEPDIYLGRPYVWAFTHIAWSLPGGSKRYTSLIARREVTYV